MVVRSCHGVGTTIIFIFTHKIPETIYSYLSRVAEDLLNNDLSSRTKIHFQVTSIRYDLHAEGTMGQAVAGVLQPAGKTAAKIMMMKRMSKSFLKAKTSEMEPEPRVDPRRGRETVQHADHLQRVV